MTWYCVGAGNAKVGRPPDVLKAVVGVGYALCVFVEGSDAAGLIHLSPDQVNSDGATTKIAESVEDVLREFGAFGVNDRERRAEIIGGADLMAVRSEPARVAATKEHLEVIRRCLESRDIAISRTRLGGTRARVVELALPCRSAVVSFVSKDRRSSVSRRQPDASAVAIVSNACSADSDVVVNMGCIEIARPPARLVAILGSCVGVTIVDQTARVAGMAHVMMPLYDGRDDAPCKYADRAVPMLVEHLLASGAELENLQAGLAGGANVLFKNGNGSLTQVGTANVEVSRRILEQLGIGVQWEHVGGQIGRKVHVSLDDFKATVKLLNSQPVEP